MVGILIKKLIVSAVLSLGIATGVYSATVEKTERIPLRMPVQMWCKDPDIIIKASRMTNGAGWALLAEHCTVLPKHYPSGRSVITKCFTVPGLQHLFLIEVKIAGIEDGNRYLTISKQALGQLIQRYNSHIECPKYIRASS